MNKFKCKQCNHEFEDDRDSAFTECPNCKSWDAFRINKVERSKIFQCDKCDKKIGRAHV
jgi:Zn finger protein HypA/HybF involved in hydrogenase expression